MPMLGGGAKNNRRRSRRDRVRVSSALELRGTARVRAALAPTIAAARGRYQKLEPRERVLVQIAGALVALFIGFNLIYLPIQDALGGLATASRSASTTRSRSRT